MSKIGSIVVAFCVAVAIASSTGSAAAASGFGDVAPDAYYREAVQWMAEQGITTGTSPGCFSPDAPATRAEVAVFLHRNEGSPAASGLPFVDVAPDRYYAAAVAWMAAEGITTGTSATTFEPGRIVTRGEVATFMHRIAGGPASGLAAFRDVGPDDFFADAVAWMAAENITTGTSPSTFSPHRAVTRAEIATLLHRAAGSPSVTVTARAACTSAEVAALLEAEQRSFELVNELRVATGLAPLTRAVAMNDFARAWSSTMHATTDFRHSAGPYAENIAWMSNGSKGAIAAAEGMHELWFWSQGHRENMLDARHTEIGIGFWQGPNGWYATHVFR